jgi:serine/threonine protein kinase
VRNPTLVADRYQLADLIGAGAMGEVWRARDLKFESRVVAVKLLKDDHTRRDDAESRARLARAVGREGTSVPAAFGASLLEEALRAGRAGEAVRTKVFDTQDPSGQVDGATLLGLFDALIDDPTCSESARLRVRLRRLFRDEANSVANLRHDNIVSISDYGDDRGTPFLAMDYIEGRTLLRLIQGGEPLRRDFQLQLMEDLCKGLAYAHRRNLVHRDIKPANLIVETGTQSLKILDFGVVRRLQDATESTLGLPIGTLCYMSPEQIAGSALVDHRSDVFSVGVVFYELLCGQKAFPPGQGMTELMSRIQHEPPAPIDRAVPHLEPGIVETLNRAIEKAPERRYQDLGEMQRDLADIRARLAPPRNRSAAAALPRRDDETVVVRDWEEPLIPRLLRRGDRAMEVGEPAVALDVANQVLSLDPSNVPALNLQARARVGLEDRQVQTDLARVEALIQVGQLPEARAAWAVARDLRPALEAVITIGRHLDQAEADEAARVVRAARVTRAIERARAALDAGGLEDALDAAREALDLEPDQREAARLLGLAESRLAARREAESREADRQRRVASLLAAYDHAMAAGRFDEALAAAAAASELAPERADLVSRRVAVEQAREEARVSRLLAQIEALSQRDDPESVKALLAGEQTLDPRLAARVRTLDEQIVKPRQRREEDARRQEALRREEENAKRREAQRLAEQQRREEEARQREKLARERGHAQPVHRENEREQTVDVVTVVPPNRSRRWFIGAVAAVLVVTSAVGGRYYFTHRSTGAGGGGGTGSTDGITNPPPPAPAAAPSTVTVDFRPWARVHIVGLSGAAAPAGQFTTPFTVPLPAGKYRLEGENGGLTQADQVEIEVRPGQPLAISREMPGFQPDRLVDRLLQGAP